MSLGSMEDITRAVGRVELPASVRAVVYLHVILNLEKGNRVEKLSRSVEYDAEGTDRLWLSMLRWFEYFTTF